MQYTVCFNRIGRNHNVPALHVNTNSEADLARKIRNYARPHLRSKDFDVMIDMASMNGFFACGMHDGGTFVIVVAA
jgi:hypothetical protein